MLVIFRERLMHFPIDFLLLTELWHLLDISAVAGYGEYLQYFNTDSSILWKSWTILKDGFDQFFLYRLIW